MHRENYCGCPALLFFLVFWAVRKSNDLKSSHTVKLKKKKKKRGWEVCISHNVNILQIFQNTNKWRRKPIKSMQQHRKESGHFWGKEVLKDNGFYLQNIMLNSTNLKFICDYVCVGIKKNSKEQQERLSGFCCTIKISGHNKKWKML